MLDFLGMFINLSNGNKMIIRHFMPLTLLFLLGIIIEEYSQAKVQ